MTDQDYMDLALRQAEEAFGRGDWPVGSVIVRDGVVLASGQNRQNTEGDVTIHGELDAIRAAFRAHGGAGGRRRAARHHRVWLVDHRPALDRQVRERPEIDPLAGGVEPSRRSVAGR